MDKAKINNEIIRLRKDVDQARVHVIKKLTRDALKLRQKKGTEAQKAKNARKAERLVCEIVSLKKIKRDDITIFNLKNDLPLDKILQNQNFEPLNRIMARIGNHKNFKTKISEFKSKYPDYMNFLGPGRKKRAILQQKLKNKWKAEAKIEDAESSKKLKDASVDDKKDSVNDLNANDIETLENKDENEFENDDDEGESANDDEGESTNDDEDESANDDEDESANDDEDESANDDEDDKQFENKSKDCKAKAKLGKNACKIKTKPSLSKKRKKSEHEKEKTEEIKPKISKKKKENLKVISKEAIVKKFNEILQDNYNSDKNKEESSNIVKSNFETKKEVDSFFVMEDGQTNYLSIAPEKSKFTDMEDDYEDNVNQFSNQRFSRQQNGDFPNNKFRNNNSKFNSNKFNSKWENQQNNARPYEQDKFGLKKDFKKSNDKYKDKSKSFNKHSKSKYEDKDNAILHPSWEAKKKQQEILKKGFQGKKIVFDDNL